MMLTLGNSGGAELAAIQCCSKGSNSKAVSGFEVKTISSWSKCKMTVWSVELRNQKFMAVHALSNDLES